MCCKFVVNNNHLVNSFLAKNIQRPRASASVSVRKCFPVTKERYTVTGNSFTDVQKNLNIEAARVIKVKSGRGKQLLGFSAISLKWSYSEVNYRRSRTGIIAQPKDLSILTSATVTLPEWKGFVSASKEDQKDWSALFVDIDKHEQVHICYTLIASDKLQAIFSKLEGIGRSNIEAKKNLDMKISATFRSHFEQLKKNQDDYDIDTDHGSIKSKQKKYNDGITQDCSRCYGN